MADSEGGSVEDKPQEKVFICPDCMRAFMTQRGMRHHMTAAHRPDAQRTAEVRLELTPRFQRPLDEEKLNAYARELDYVAAVTEFLPLLSREIERRVFTDEIHDRDLVTAFFLLFNDREASR